MSNNDILRVAVVGDELVDRFFLDLGHGDGSLDSQAARPISLATSGSRPSTMESAK